MLYLKNLLKKKLEKHRKLEIFYLIALIHLVKFIFSSNYRYNRCLVDPPSKFFYKYKSLTKYFSIPLLLFAKYLKKKKIFISVNNDCNFSIGHIFTEIAELKKLQKFDERYSDSIVWFSSSRKEILNDTKDLFENENFRVFFGGITRIFLTFVAIKCPSISIDASLGAENYIFGKKSLSNRIVFHNKSKRRGKMMIKSQEFYPLKENLNKYKDKTLKLLKDLNIKNKFIVIQTKMVKTNATFDILDLKFF